MRTVAQMSRSILVYSIVISGTCSVLAAKPVVYTTFYPLQYFVERIAGDAATVVNPVPESEDPIFWMPSREVVKAYYNADLIVINGANFEQWIEKVSLPPEKIVNTSLPFKTEWIRYETAVTHSHGTGGEHSHEGIDGHTWLDPVNARVQASRIHDALAQKFATHAGKFKSGLDALLADFDSLNHQFESLASLKSMPLLASHPAYNYIKRRYGWDIVNLDLDPEATLSDKQIAHAKEILKTHKAKVILWESDPIPQVIAQMAELGLKSVTFSPCESLSADERAAGQDYLKVMRRNIERLRSL